MSHSVLCRIQGYVVRHYVVWHYVLQDYVAFGVMSFGITSHSALCHIRHYVTFGLMWFGIVSFDEMLFGIMWLGVMSFGLLSVKNHSSLTEFRKKEKTVYKPLFRRKTTSHTFLVTRHLK